MSVVDEKGRLFGKINLLDLVVILVILAVVGRFGYKAFKKGEVNAAGTDKTVEITVRLSNVTEATVNALQINDEVYDSKSNTLMGKVTEVRQQPAIVVSTGSDGRLYEHESKTALDVFLTIAGPGRVSPNSVTMNSLEVRIGGTNDLKTAIWKGSGPVVDIKR